MKFVSLGKYVEAVPETSSEIKKMMKFPGFSGKIGRAHV